MILDQNKCRKYNTDKIEQIQEGRDWKEGTRAKILPLLSNLGCPMLTNTNTNTNTNKNTNTNTR